MHLTSDDPKVNVLRRAGAQPIALAAAALVIVFLGIGAIGLWRAYTGNSPEQERATSARLLQARAAQASETLVEKTKALETSQQESIDQLQGVQDQLQTVRRLLAAQQGETKKLSEQVGSLTGAIDTLRQSFASVQSSETAAAPARARPEARLRSRHSSYRKRAKTRS
ncbi:MAG TPA: hypothetical protein VE865_17155 [Bradyrhizobium sp.]|nr:hypothetical protein [Bradyrhizobium sp.]